MIHEIFIFIFEIGGLFTHATVMNIWQKQIYPNLSNNQTNRNQTSRPPAEGCSLQRRLLGPCHTTGGGDGGGEHPKTPRPSNPHPPLLPSDLKPAMARVASSHFGLLRELPPPRLDPSDLPRRLRQATVLRLRSTRPLRLPKMACLAESKPVEPPPIESPPEVNPNIFFLSRLNVSVMSLKGRNHFRRADRTNPSILDQFFRLRSIQ